MQRLAQRCRDAGIPWSVDLEPTTFPDGIASLIPVLDGATTVSCNSRAAGRLGHDPVALLRDLGVASVIATCCPDGAVLHQADETVAVAAPPVGLLDTTGAGDCLAGWKQSFCAGPRVAHFDRVQWQTTPDPATQVAALQAGEVDWVEQPLMDLMGRLWADRSVKVQVAETKG